MAVPLPLDASACGALRLSRRAGRPAFDDTEVALVSRLADQAAIALELARRRAESEELAVLQERDRIARDLHDLAISRSSVHLSPALRRSASASAASNTSQ